MIPFSIYLIVALPAYYLWTTILHVFGLEITGVGLFCMQGIVFGWSRAVTYNRGWWRP